MAVTCAHPECTTLVTKFSSGKDDQTMCWKHQPKEDEWCFSGIHFAFCATCDELIQVKASRVGEKAQCASCRSQFAQVRS